MAAATIGKNECERRSLFMTGKSSTTISVNARLPCRRGWPSAVATCHPGWKNSFGKAAHFPRVAEKTQALPGNALAAAASPAFRLFGQDAGNPLADSRLHKCDQGNYGPVKIRTAPRTLFPQQEHPPDKEKEPRKSAAAVPAGSRFSTGMRWPGG